MLSDRSQSLLDIRPSIPTIVESDTSEAEAFQNKTLRPILKFQHELLIAIFRQYIVKRKNVFPKLSRQQQEAYIEQAVRKDLKFKNLLLGTIIGHFTVEEWEIFQEQENELSRRISSMLVQRLQDALIGEGI